jgi:hypothetical protein
MKHYIRLFTSFVAIILCFALTACGSIGWSNPNQARRASDAVGAVVQIAAMEAAASFDQEQLAELRANLKRASKDCQFIVDKKGEISGYDVVAVVKHIKDLKFSTTVNRRLTEAAILADALIGRVVLQRADVLALKAQFDKALTLLPPAVSKR